MTVFGPFLFEWPIFELKYHFLFYSNNIILGMTGEDTQDLSLGSFCYTKGLSLHEFIHALGTYWFVGF